MISLSQKKTARLSLWRFFGVVGVWLAGPFRQQAGEEVEEIEEPAAHSAELKHGIAVLV
jgi:hypothetical protein